jgi:hypothetical protein
MPLHLMASSRFAINPADRCGVQFGARLRLGRDRGLRSVFFALLFADRVPGAVAPAS